MRHWIYTMVERASLAIIRTCSITFSDEFHTKWRESTLHSVLRKTLGEQRPKKFWVYFNRWGIKVSRTFFRDRRWSPTHCVELWFIARSTIKQIFHVYFSNLICFSNTQLFDYNFPFEHVWSAAWHYNYNIFIFFLTCFGSICCFFKMMYLLNTFFDIYPYAIPMVRLWNMSITFA